MIKGYCKFNLLDKAIELIDLMKKNDIFPDEIIFNTLLDGCSKLGKVENAYKVYDIMRTSGI